MNDMNGTQDENDGTGGNGGTGDSTVADDEFDDSLLEEELRQAAGILDPVPPELNRLAVEAYALHDLEARLAELTFDSLVDALPIRGETDPPRMLTFRAGEVSLDVEVSADGLFGQVMPPQPARIEVLSGPQTARSLAADDMGRFTGDVPPAGPFALRLRAGGEVVMTEWMRA
ncbi:hypothetical protein [Streptomyces sp. CRN 30]|uniref:hypothetical protein n=1 Tax=Streptomyces sp. CRN 30 TaxID=3075613 RepID=UPI002A807210|nr:hypothetical protein [Streptomyces sp. CRN 30]